MRALMLIPLVALPVLTLTACSGENQGWNPNYRAEATPYGDYLRARELALTGQQAEPPRVIPLARPFKAPTAAQIAGPSPVAILERDTTRTAHAVGIRPSQTIGAVSRPGAPAIDHRTSGLYGGHGAPRAVAAVPATTVVVAPAATVVTRPGAPAVVTTTPLPPAGATDPLVSYAFANRHAPGNRVYARSGGAGGSCTRYPSPAEAQRAFLAQGGPLLDPLGLDPDGDGFVCGWDPAPYRVSRL